MSTPKLITFRPNPPPGNEKLIFCQIQFHNENIHTYQYLRFKSKVTAPNKQILA